MPQMQFEGRLESDREAHFIRVPAAVLTALGEEKRMPVKVTINGYAYRSRIAVYGGQSYLGLRREVREAACVVSGGKLTVTLDYAAELRPAYLPAGWRSAL